MLCCVGCENVHLNPFVTRNKLPWSYNMHVCIVLGASHLFRSQHVYVDLNGGNAVVSQFSCESVIRLEYVWMVDII